MENIREQLLNFSSLGQLVEQALHGVQREYPNSVERFVPGQNPREVHPAFYGCYDWHSAVHTHWLLVRLLRHFPGLGQASAIRAVINANLTAENLKAELVNFGPPDRPVPDHRVAANSQPGQPAFERPYGWAWLLQLAAELYAWDDPDGQRWTANLQPLTRKIVELFTRFLVESNSPARDGQHRNTAFALGLALDYARVCGQPALENLIIKYGRDYYLPDTDYPAQAEPGPTDFFSPALTEAAFMRRILAPPDFSGWFRRFLPGIEAGQPASLLEPVIVADHNDPYISHLDGLNLSRAWCMYNIATGLPESAPGRPVLLRAAERHALEGIKYLLAGNFSSTGHWLATFAVYLLATILEIGG